MVRFTSDLDAAVTGSGFVQECAPERVELKRELLQQVAIHTGADVPLASSSSAIVASRIADGLDAARRLQRILIAIRETRPTCCRSSRWWRHT